MEHNVSNYGGAGIFQFSSGNYNTLVLSETEVNNNLVVNLDQDNVRGGGIAFLLGQLILNSTTLAYNSVLSDSKGFGGGLFAITSGDLLIDRSTISGNTVGGKGGGVWVDGTSATLTRTTIINNQALDGGGYVQNFNSNEQQSVIMGSAITDNLGPLTSPDFLLLGGTLSSGGYNLIGNDTANQFTQLTTDIEGISGDFGPLADNGGETMTHLPNLGSAAIDVGNADDQSRDQIGNPVYSGRRDIGSTEYSPSIFYADFDGDGFGDADLFTYGNQPANYVENNLDNCPYVFNPSQEDSDGDGVGDACPDGSVATDEFYLAAECAEVGSKFTIISNSSTGEKSAIYTSTSSNGAPPPDLEENRVRFVIPNAIAGDYDLFARIRAQNTISDSYWVRLNDGPWIKWWEGLTTTTFAWREVVQGPYSLIDGRNTIDFAYREAYAELEKIQLTITPPGGGTLPTDGPGGELYSCTTTIDELEDQFYLEAECAEVGSAFLQFSAQTASRNNFVKFTGTRSMDDPPANVPANRVRFSAFNMAAGNYKFYARVRAPDGNSDSFWIRVNGGPWMKWASGVGTSVFAWKLVMGTSYPLDAGYNYIDFAYREPNTELDKLYFGIDGIAPTDTGPDASNLCD